MKKVLELLVCLLHPVAVIEEAADRYHFGERRKAAHRAVGAELDRLEPELLKLLGLSANGSPNPSDVR